jgi:hypothetical protein
MKKQQPMDDISLRWKRTKTSQRLCINDDINLYLAEVEDGYVYCYADPYGDVVWIDFCEGDMQEARNMAFRYLMQNKIITRKNMFDWSKK